jgi:hypothetical protein
MTVQLIEPYACRLVSKPAPFGFARKIVAAGQSDPRRFRAQIPRKGRQPFPVTFLNLHLTNEVLKIPKILFICQQIYKKITNKGKIS